MNFAQVLNRITTGRAMIIGLILAAFYYFAFMDKGAAQHAAIEASRSRMGELQTQINDGQTKLDNAEVYKRTAAEVGTTIEKLLTLIPENFNMADLMRIVSNEAKSAGSSLATIEPKTTEVSAVAPEFEELTVSLELQGSFLQHMVFFANLTRVQQILIVRKFEFSHMRDGKADEAPQVKLTAEVVAYRYRGKAAAAARPEDGSGGQPGAGAPE